LERTLNASRTPVTSPKTKYIFSRCVKLSMSHYVKKIHNIYLVHMHTDHLPERVWKNSY